ncbi:RDD family protein [Flaviaesturariibacter terrae]
MRYASLFRRGAAFLVDAWLLQLLTATLGRRFAVDRSENVLGTFRYPGFSYQLHYSTFVLLGSALFLAWFLFFESGTTLASPGKALFGLRLYPGDGLLRISFGRSLFRTLCRWLLAATGPLLLVYLLLARRRVLPHDRWTGVRIVKRLEVAPGAGQPPLARRREHV